jgi:hypothetical protein
VVETPTYCRYEQNTITPIYVYRAFHNVLRDYKHLYQENQRTYLNGIVHSHRKTDYFSKEEEEHEKIQTNSLTTRLS